LTEKLADTILQLTASLPEVFKAAFFDREVGCLIYLSISALTFVLLSPGGSRCNVWGYIQKS
jgi:hypothetical protein